MPTAAATGRRPETIYLLFGYLALNLLFVYFAICGQVGQTHYLQKNHLTT